MGGGWSQEGMQCAGVGCEVGCGGRVRAGVEHGHRPIKQVCCGVERSVDSYGIWIACPPTDHAGTVQCPSPAGMLYHPHPSTHPPHLLVLLQEPQLADDLSAGDAAAAAPIAASRDGTGGTHHPHNLAAGQAKGCTAAQASSSAAGAGCARQQQAPAVQGSSNMFLPGLGSLGGHSFPFGKGQSRLCAPRALLHNSPPTGRPLGPVRCPASNTPTTGPRTQPQAAPSPGRPQPRGEIGLRFGVDWGAPVWVATHAE